jgi:hypothetical protein
LTRRDQPITHVVDDLGRVGSRCGRDGLRADTPVDLDTNRALQPPRGTTGAGVDGLIEHHAIDARGQLVASTRVPVAGFVDVAELLVGDRPELIDAHRRAVMAPEHRQGNAPVGRAPGIGGVVGESALMHEDVGQRGLEIIFHPAHVSVIAPPWT